MNRLGVVIVTGMLALGVESCCKKPQSTVSYWNRYPWQLASDHGSDADCEREERWCTGDAGSGSGSGSDADWVEPGRDTATIICVDATGYGSASKRVPRRRTTATTSTYDTVIEPNKALDIRVVLPPGKSPIDEQLTIAVNGTVGETTNQTSGVSASTENKATPVAVVEDANTDPFTRTPKRCGAYEQRFAPRTPGPAVVTLTFGKPTPKIDNSSNDDAGEKSGSDTNGNLPSASADANAYAFELMVPHIYSGALRVGVSALLGQTDHEYSTRKQPDSVAGQIVDGGSSPWGAEVVLGYAPFAEALGRNSGRDYVHDYSAFSWHRLAPYVGLGLATAVPNGTSTRVEWLKSFYFGGEYEPFQDFSLAFTVALRRVDHLANGLAVGDAVADSTQLTDNRIGVAFGLVLSFSPDFFRFASSVGAPK